MKYEFCHLGVDQPFCYVVCEHLHNLEEGCKLFNSLLLQARLFSPKVILKVANFLCAALRLYSFSFPSDYIGLTYKIGTTYKYLDYDMNFSI